MRGIVDMCAQKNLKGVIIVSTLLTALAGCGIGGGVEPDVEGHQMAFDAASIGDWFFVQGAVESGGMAIDATDGEGRSLLHYAAASGQAHVVNNILSDFEANPNVTDGRGLTPLDYAEANGYQSTVDVLRQYGAQ